MVAAHRVKAERRAQAARTRIYPCNAKLVKKIPHRQIATLLRISSPGSAQVEILHDEKVRVRVEGKRITVHVNEKQVVDYTEPDIKYTLVGTVGGNDPDTGMSVQMIRYEAGFTNPWHRHNCAHGIYILEGSLRTHQGTFGPGSFVWFPEGMLMEHGATDDAAVTTLFITNKPFDIRYAFEDEQDGSTG